MNMLKCVGTTFGRFCPVRAIFLADFEGLGTDFEIMLGHSRGLIDLP